MTVTLQAPCQDARIDLYSKCVFGASRQMRIHIKDGWDDETDCVAPITCTNP